MESNKNLIQGNERTPGVAENAGSTTRQSATAPTRAKEEVSNIKERANEMVDQTRKVVSNAYEGTSQALGNTYEQAITYGRNNPGTAMLIAFGAGVGIGVLLASGLPGRSRMSRIAEPVVTALSQVALEFLR